MISMDTNIDATLNLREDLVFYPYSPCIDTVMRINNDSIAWLMIQMIF
jgi:hypothetical protein